LGRNKTNRQKRQMRKLKEFNGAFLNKVKKSLGVA